MSSPPTYRVYWPEAARRWDAMERTRKSEADAAARKLFANKARYVAVQERTKNKVPWWWIACTHMRESSASFNRQFAQGDPLGHVSVNVPRGMGPYFGADAWERSAIEGLEHDRITEVIDWRLEKAMYYWEKFNGWGYWLRGYPSPYVLAGTNQYKRGKFVSDGVWDPTEIDQQLGCAPILKSLMELDPTIRPKRETPEGVKDQPATPEPPMSQVPTPQPVPPAQQMPQLDLAKLESLLDTVAGFAASPMVASFLPPQVRAFLPLIPILKEILEAVKQWQTGAHDFPSLVGIMSELLSDVSRELQGVKVALAKP